MTKTLNRANSRMWAKRRAKQDTVRDILKGFSGALDPLPISQAKVWNNSAFSAFAENFHVLSVTRNLAMRKLAGDGVFCDYDLVTPGTIRHGQASRKTEECV